MKSGIRLLFCLMGALALCAGCTTPPMAPSLDTTTSARAEDASAKPIATLQGARSAPVFRYARYTLVTPAAPIGLLDQIVDFSIPLFIHGQATTVRDGLRYALMRSGYRLCDSGDAIEVFDAWVLPIAHTRLGPMPLREALTTLAGGAWVLRIDERKREVCFDAAVTDAPLHGETNDE